MNLSEFHFPTAPVVGRPFARGSLHASKVDISPRRIGLLILLIAMNAGLAACEGGRQIMAGNEQVTEPPGSSDPDPAPDTELPAACTVADGAIQPFQDRLLS